MDNQPKKSRTGISGERPQGHARPEGAAVAGLAQAIRTHRLRARLTQKDLAALANTGVRFIVELEQGKPTLEIGKALDVLQTLGLELRIETLRPLRRPDRGEP